MGIVSDGDTAAFSSRARVKFTLSGETDNGLTFGASFRADQASGATGGTDGTVFLSGAFGTLTMGAPVGAAEAAVGDLSGVGYTGLGDISDTLFITGDGLESEPIVQYAYTAGDFSGYLSTTSGAFDSNYAVGAAYKMGDYNFGLGYESSDDLLDLGAGIEATHLVGSVGGTFGAIAVKAIYGTANLDQPGPVDIDLNQYGVSATYTADALAVTGFYKAIEGESGGVSADASGLGLGVAYDLGGGAAVKAGLVNYDVDAPIGTLLGITNNDTVYDVGVTFSF